MNIPLQVIIIPHRMLNKYKYIVDTSRDFITLINRNYVYEVVNPAYERSIKKPLSEILNRSVAHVWGEEIFETKVKGYLDRCFSGEEVHYIETFKFGLANRYMHVSFYPYREDDRDVSHALVFSHDISKLGKIESKLINYEYRDPLTGLFNQKSLDIILEMELEKAKRSKLEKLRAILFIDITNFKEVTQKYGHEIGHVLLENTGLRVKECLRESDFIFSFMGSELVAILTQMSKNADAARVAEKIYYSITNPYQYKQYSIKLKAGIGIAIFPDDGTDQPELMQKAVSAARESDCQGKPYMLFDEELHRQAVERLNMEAELTSAFRKQEFLLYYQPIVDQTGRIKGAEALIRWNHDQKGLVSPIDFIPVAEDTGLIDEIGKWVIFAAVRQLSRWNRYWDIYLSLNLCAREFGNQELVEIVKNALGQVENLDPRHLKLEITESEGIEDPVSFIEKINKLKELGVEIYIDDFGTGQSSLEYLKSIPADVLKIDRTFVRDIDSDGEDREFLTSMVSMIRTRNKKIIVEGISTREQAEIVRSLGCDRMQGFYFSKPVTAGEFQALLAADRTLPL